jgi:predicted transcriptional regulator
MRPNNANILEANESAKSKRDPQNVHENSVMGNEAMIRPRRGGRARIPHSMWKEFVKK